MIPHRASSLFVIGTVLLSIATVPVNAQPLEKSGVESCSRLPKGVAVLSSARACGRRPAVVLTRRWRGIFSAAFRWRNGDHLEDRSPFALDDGSASSSPYKTQRRLRRRRGEVLCYGNFVRDRRFPLPEQLTIKRTVSPTLTRFCVNFTRRR